MVTIFKIRDTIIFGWKIVAVNKSSEQIVECHPSTFLQIIQLGRPEDIRFMLRKAIFCVLKSPKFMAC